MQKIKNLYKSYHRKENFCMKNLLKHNKPALFIGLILLVAIGAYYFIHLEGDGGGTQVSK